MTKDQNCNPLDLKCKAIVALGSVAIYIMFFQLDIISAQIAIAFNIPIQITGIYIEKLYSMRTLTFTLGIVVLYITFEIYSKINPKDDPHEVRVIIKQTSFCIMLAARIILTLVTFFSSNLAYHVYIALGFESFGVGCSGTYNMATTPQHTTIVIMSSHLSRLLTFLLQFVLDLVFRENSLPKIRIQFLFCTILNLMAVICFFYYHKSSCECSNKPKKQKSSDEKKTEETQTPKPETSEPQQQESQTSNNKQLNFIETFDKVASPFFMYSIGSMLFDTVYPGVIPYAILPRDKCHLINMLSPIANLSGPLTLFALENAGKYDNWSPPYNAGWLFTIPMSIIAVYTLLAVHTRIPSARKIINNRPRIWAMTFVGALGNSFLDPLSFSGVAKILFLSDFIPDLGVLLLHEFVCITIRYYHDKISVGYNVVRVDLGYVFPKFRPTHRMSKWNTFWYILRQTFKKARRDVINDFKLDIRKYF